MNPESVGNFPSMTLRTVDSPDPVGPTKAVKEPFSTVKETSVMAGDEPSAGKAVTPSRDIAVMFSAWPLALRRIEVSSILLFPVDKWLSKKDVLCPSNFRWSFVGAKRRNFCRLAKQPIADTHWGMTVSNLAAGFVIKVSRAKDVKAWVVLRELECFTSDRTA